MNHYFLYLIAYALFISHAQAKDERSKLTEIKSLDIAIVKGSTSTTIGECKSICNKENRRFTGAWQAPYGNKVAECSCIKFSANESVKIEPNIEETKIPEPEINIVKVDKPIETPVKNANYEWDEAKNPKGPNRCSSDMECYGLRTCSPFGWCQYPK